MAGHKSLNCRRIHPIFPHLMGARQNLMGLNQTSAAGARPRTWDEEGAPPDGALGERYRSFFEDAPIGMFTTTAEGRAVEVNAAFARMLGFATAHEACQHYTDLAKQLYVRAEDRAEIISLLRQRGRVNAFEAEVKTKDDRIIWLALTAQKAQVPADGRFLIDGFAVDITERKKAQLASISRQQQMECFFRIVQITQRADLSLQEALHEVARVLPMGWRHHQEVVSRLAWGELEIETGNLACSPNVLSAKLRAHGRDVGSMRIGYTRGPGHHGPDPFEEEEKELLETVAEQLGRLIEQRESQQALRRSERKLRATLDALPASIALVDERGDILQVNRAWRQFAAEAGTAPEEVSEGCNCLQVCEGTTGPEAEQATSIASGLRKVLRGEVDYFSMEYPCDSPNGPAWFLAHVARCHDGGKPKAVVAHENITNLKKAEETMRQLNAIMLSVRDINRLLSSAGDPADILDGAIDTLVHTRQFHYAKYVLLDKENGAQRSSHVLADTEEQWPAPPLAEQLDEALKYVLQSGIPLVAETSPSSPASNLEGPRGYMIVPLMHDHRIRGAIAVIGDLHSLENPEEQELLRELGADIARGLHSLEAETQNQRMMQDLVVAKEAAEAACRAKDEFLAVMSHEMRTPLNPILGFANLLQDSCRTRENRECAQEIITSGEHLLELIDSVLYFTQLNEGRTKPKVAAFNLFEVCHAALDEVKPQAEGLELTFDSDQPLSTILDVRGDETMLRQVLDNLLSNACKYTPTGSVRLKASVESEPNAAAVRILFEVEDTGIGISTSDQEKLFKPFTQADGSYTRRYEGIGLGLATCKKLVDLMGGEIGVDSQEGGGSRFWFHAPFEPVSTEDQPIAH